MSTARTIRRFTAEPVADEVLARCLQAATWAPSGANAQGWRFVVLRSAEQRAVVAPPETRHVAGLDLLCPTLLVIHTSPVLGEADADAIVGAARNLLAKRLELGEGDLALLDEPLARWRASWTARLLEPTPKNRATNYTLAQSIDAGESTLVLYRDLLSNPGLSEAARKQLTDDPGFLVPRILAP